MIATSGQPPRDAAGARPDPIAVSPDYGPLPPVYVPLGPGAAARSGLARRAWRAWRARRNSRRAPRPRGS